VINPFSFISLSAGLGFVQLSISFAISGWDFCCKYPALAVAGLLVWLATVFTTLKIPAVGIFIKS